MQELVCDKALSCENCDSRIAQDNIPSGLAPIKIVLAGQPNVGKSSLINAISNSRLKVGNFSGVTVESTKVCFTHHCHNIEFIDLPGTYSIEGFTTEEKVAKKYLLNEEYDVILNIIDSTHLNRNLLLSLELMSLNKKMVIALNFADELEKEGIELDVKQLQSLLGVPVILVSSKTKQGIPQLLDTLHTIADDNIRKKSNLTYSDVIEEAIYNIKEFLDKKHFQIQDLDTREIAIKSLFKDEQFYNKIYKNPIFVELQPLLIQNLKKIYTYYESDDINEIKAIEYNSIARGIRAEVVKKTTKTPKDITKKIDAILINKYFGLPLFLFFMWVLFQLTFSLGEVPMEYIDAGISWLGDAVSNSISHDGLKSLLVDGIINGVGAVILFLPNIIILYIGIALLETTGYMSRVAFLLDGFFHKFGLHGKSFIPLVTGFGCSVPAYMATRTLKNKKDRLITLFIIGFMSCGARLPVYVLFAGAFFGPESAGNIIFIIYIAGAMLGLVMAKILRIFVFKNEDEPFAMEMPKYRLPSLKLIYSIVSMEAWLYLKKAGTFILGVTILIWYLSNYPKPQNYDTLDSKAKIEQSYLGQIGKFSEPFFQPLGCDWRQAVALEAGLAAKEVIVATLGVLYNVGEDVDENNDALLKNLKKEITLPSAISFLIFVMIYLPCAAASMVFVKEAGSYKYLLYLFLMTTALAWILSFVGYNITKLII